MIIEIFAQHYLLIKALHIISVMFWMAGMFYLPRLFVYHTRTKAGSEMDKTFIIMEDRLLKIIINPSMIASLLFGLALIFAQGWENLGHWFHAKILLLILLLAVHGKCIKYKRAFASGLNKKSGRYFRIFNEFAPISALIIVILAVMKPF
jgi:putative membrane protein